MTIAERYARAITSSHLELKVELGDLDSIIAAGMVQDSLGVALLRLRSEFDSISTMPNARNMLPRLKSTAGVRLKLLGLIFDRKPLEISGEQASEIAAALLDHWCDPKCPNCGGRGTIGAFGAPQTICIPCGGTKRRTLFWPESIEYFADSIAMTMEETVDTAQRRIQRLLRQK